MSATSWSLIVISIFCLAVIIATAPVRTRRHGSRVLHALSGNPDGMTGREIGMTCRLAAPYVTLAQLEEERLVLREEHLHSEDDRPPFYASYIYKITPQGRRTLARPD